VHKRRENKPLKLREEGIEEVDEFIYLSRVIAKKNGTKDARKKKQSKKHILKMKQDMLLKYFTD
jgi:hypothetical protein